ncbi:MAG: ATP-binding protein [Planctomycetes bacterium]|nr:ATP-binding protein [Planctomycetota bacterium]
MTQLAQFDVWIPNDTAEARDVQERIIGLMEQNAWPMRDCFGVRLSLEEALVNAIKHGNRMDPDKKVYIACELTEDEVIVVIEDQGDGFKIEEVPDPTEDNNLEKPGGRGIMLIRSFMTGVGYNDKGNRLTMSKKLGVVNKDETD